MTPIVILAGDALDRRTRTAALRLAASGYEIKGVDLATPEGALKRTVVLLWSRTARKTPALLKTARCARKTGRFVCLRLDATLPPNEFGGASAAYVPVKRLQPSELRRLARRSSRPMTGPAPLARASPTTRRVAENFRVTAPRAPATEITHARRGGSPLALFAAAALVALAAGAEAFALGGQFTAQVRELVAGMVPGVR